MNAYKYEEASRIKGCRSVRSWDTYRLESKAFIGFNWARRFVPVDRVVATDCRLLERLHSKSKREQTIVPELDSEADTSTAYDTSKATDSTIFIRQISRYKQPCHKSRIQNRWKNQTASKTCLADKL